MQNCMTYVEMERNKRILNKLKPFVQYFLIKDILKNQNANQYYSISILFKSVQNIISTINMTFRYSMMHIYATYTPLHDTYC